MAIVTGDRYLEKLVKFVNQQAGPLIEGTLVLKLNPAGLHYVQSRLEALHELEQLLAGAPVDYLRAYVSDLGDHRALEHLRRILRLLTSLKVVSVLPPPVRDPTPLSFLPFGRLKVLELRGCDLSTSAARGLLELRHTLEKIICHNSTDALRHLFASRIAEIKNSPQWNRLSFVSCACNGLILMDESLQLLPAVETLDLSRNRFTKVDNLRKCAKLKHLDLGFNQLRTIAPFTEVCRHIVKLVLRNNALTTLRGIENLKSLEGLDVSYNVISKFSEIEILAGLSSLRSLWLEGNPLCCARWYRAHIFSFFTYPEKLKLDDKEVNTYDLWKRQIIMASKDKQPASFGFYLPAKDEAIEEAGSNRRRRTVSRLALIESGEEVTDIFSDQESVSFDNESQKREDPDKFNDEAEIVDLINRVELMKKENSSLWLREFKDWMDISTDKLLENSKEGRATLYRQKEHFMKSKPSQGQSGEVSRYASDSFLASGDESSTIILESDNSFVDMSAGFHSQQHFDHRGSLDKADLPQIVREHLKPFALEGINVALMHSRNSHSDTVTSQGGYRMGENVNTSPLTAFDDISGSYSSSGFPSSPPHYQEDLLHRRQNLVEEILQLSADSFSVASSNSNTSCSEVDCGEFEQSVPEVNDVANIHYSNGNVDVQISLNQLKGKFYSRSQEISHVRENGICTFDSSADHTSKQWFDDFAADADNNERAYTVNQDADWLENKKHRKKAKKRVISILDESLDGDACNHGSEFEHEQNKQPYYPSEYQGVVGKGVMPANVKRELDLDDFNEYSGDNFCTRKSDDFIVTYFNARIADSEAHETCSRCMRCSFVLQRDSICREREVAVLLSSHKKLYVLLISVAADGSGTLLSLLSCHKSKEICEVVVGIGLQVVRVNFEGGGGYLFITRSIEKSRELLWVLQVSDSSGANERCSVRSLEQVQVQLFENQVCGGSDVSIYQYAMVLVSRSGNEELWQSRSLFVMGGHVLLCDEDVSHFCSISSEASLPSYFRIDSCCFIADVTEVVLEIGESYCVTLALKRLMSEFQPSAQPDDEAVTEGKVASGFLKLKLRWFSKCDLLNFTALLKAIHAGKMKSPLIVGC